jgi:hypothetical protein
MSCGKEADLLNAYLAAEERYRAEAPKAHAFVPGEPLHREILDVERIERLTRLEGERDAAERAWHAHLSPNRLAPAIMARDR